jgi:hypothetical protein
MDAIRATLVVGRREGEREQGDEEAHGAGA